MTSPLGVPLIPREPENLLKRLVLRAHDLAIADIGKGEVEHNNSGPYVWSLFGKRVSGAWCAALQYAKLLEAAKQLGMVCPIERTHSARKFCEQVAAIGRWLSPGEIPERGDYMLKARPPKPWHGHVGQVNATTWPRFRCVEGNVGDFPADTDLFPHRAGERNLLGFARLWK